MFKFKKKSKEIFKNIAQGKVVAIENVPDGVFAGKMMGDGYAIELSEGTIHAPISGEITMVFPTGHAYGLKTDSGIEVLIHIGIDTVELEGKGFNGVVQQGERVKQGDILTRVDIDYIKEKGKSIVTPVIFTSGETLSLLKENESVDQTTEDIFKFD